MSEPVVTIENKEKFGWKNRIIWILIVTVFWYLGVCSIPGELLFSNNAYFPTFYDLIDRIGYMTDASKFASMYYLSTITAFIGAFVYTGVTKRNRFIFRSFLPSCPANKLSALMKGLLVGFIMNSGCILWALLAGNIKLFLNFTVMQIPFYIFALVCVFLQSSAEELWTRGFMYERINVRYPLWVAILINGVFFGFMHIFNDGVGFLPILDICICGLGFSLAKWYTGSIWFPMGIHTAWNFTQNFLFGLPNSGLISEASVFGLDAANARSSMIYDVAFGVEGGVPAVLADAVLGIVCLILAAKKGRLGELLQKQVTAGKDPMGPQPLHEPPREQTVQGEPLNDGTAQWRYADEGRHDRADGHYGEEADRQKEENQGRRL